MFANDFCGGLTHPLAGLDHVFTMLSIGLLASMFGRLGFELVPVWFLFLLLLGTFLGVFGLTFNFVIPFMSISVLLLGLLLVLKSKYNIHIVVILIFITICGFVNGNVHSSQMPVASQSIAFSFGFLISTLILVAIGSFTGYIIKQKDNPQFYYSIAAKLLTFIGLYIYLVN